MFNTMRMYHKKFTSLNNLTPRTENKEKQKQEVLVISIMNCITFTKINTIKK